MPPAAPPRETGSRLRWVRTLFGPGVPEWVVEPDLQSIKKTLQKIHEVLEAESDRPKPPSTDEGYVPSKQTANTSDELQVSFCAQGGFNKLYTVSTNHSVTPRDYMMRVSLPVDPRHKTLSEVATIAYIQATGADRIPVPRIFAFNADEQRGENAIGFEWILMEKMPGVPLEDVWNEMKFDKKEQLVDVVVDMLAGLFNLRSETIGNLYVKGNQIMKGEEYQRLRGKLEEEKDFATGRIVSMPFFWDNRITMDVSRGPFTTDMQWLLAELELIQADCKRMLAVDPSSEDYDEDDVEDAQDLQACVEGLTTHIHLIFPLEDHPEEGTKSKEPQCALHHGDISFHNILMSHTTHDPTAVIDWECCPFMPLWKVCQFPSFLDGVDREGASPPRASLYALDEDTDQPNQLYFEHLREWEQTVLRKRFLARMRRVENGWVELFESEQARKKRDFREAVEHCGAMNILAYKGIKQWLAQFDAGEAGNKPKEGGEYLSLWKLLYAWDVSNGELD